MAAPGRLVELSGRGASAKISAAVSLVRSVQSAGDTAVWIQPRGGGLFPPDLAASGVDLEALLVLHIPGERGAHDLLRAAELLLLAGAHGLVIVDLTGLRAPRGGAWQARLAALARRHGSALVLLTDSPDRHSSLGPMISLRVAPRRTRSPAGHLAITSHVLKNKSGGPADLRPQLYRSPAGARAGR
ncbi:MAG: recombinase A [Nannocystis sp.]|nr:recombinase A [Nannocystis sp.]